MSKKTVNDEIYAQACALNAKAKEQQQKEDGMDKDTKTWVESLKTKSLMELGSLEHFISKRIKQGTLISSSEKSYKQDLILVQQAIENLKKRAKNGEQIRLT